MPVLCLTFLNSGKVFFIGEKSGNFKKGQPCKFKRARCDIQIK